MPWMRDRRGTRDIFRCCCDHRNLDRIFVWLRLARYSPCKYQEQTNWNDAFQHITPRERDCILGNRRQSDAGPLVQLCATLPFIAAWFLLCAATFSLGSVAMSADFIPKGLYNFINGMANVVQALCECFFVLRREAADEPSTMRVLKRESTCLHIQIAIVVMLDHFTRPSNTVPLPEVSASAQI